METPDHGKPMENAAEPNGRLMAFGNQLIDVHIWLREELAQLRADLPSSDSLGGRPRELRVHCLAFCSALGRHHTGEETEAFPALAAEFPELRPVLEELERDHVVVAGIVRRLNELVGVVGDNPPDAAMRIGDEVDGPAALLESHFVYEEKRIVAALNSLSAPGWRGSPPDFLLTPAPDISIER